MASTSRPVHATVSMGGTTVPVEYLAKDSPAFLCGGTPPPHCRHAVVSHTEERQKMI